MVSSPLSEPSTALYGVLGLLAVRPMTTYELAKHFDRSLGRVWPRARSKLFEAPKKLEGLGFARGRRGRVGLRPRTVYSITAKGRRALAAWLAEPGSGPELEFEALLKFFFAEHAPTAVAVANLEMIRDWARAQIDEHITVGRAYLEGTGAFQERVAVNMITGTFFARFAIMVEQWSEWALSVVASWPSDPRNATPDVASMKRIVDDLENLRSRSWGTDR